MSDNGPMHAVVGPRMVAVQAVDPVRFEPVVGPRRMAEFDAIATAARYLFDGRAVVNVNSTASGGGVAEMLQTMLAYARGVGVDARWAVVEADVPFFAITKRVHHHIYGNPGDGGALGPAERAYYDDVLRANGERLASVVRADDLVVLHDPQAAGLAPEMRARGARVVWRCHIGRDTPNEYTERGWEFLRPYLEHAEACVFSRRAFAPGWLEAASVHVIPPSIDPFSTKNQALDERDLHSLLAFAGFGGLPDPSPVRFTRRDGSPGRIEQPVAVFLDDAPAAGDQLVVQVSRWDPMKDMEGVMLAFAEHVDRDAHLVLAGPEVEGVADDPEAATVLGRCQATWESLAPATRARVHLACVPMYDVDANALLTNAIQRSAAIVTQKSIAEGFGLTVAEAMWKERAVVATRVGGIPEQIEHEVTGLLVDDPGDLAAFGRALNRLLDNRAFAHELAGRGRRYATDQLLGDRHLERWGVLFTSLIG